MIAISSLKNRPAIAKVSFQKFNELSLGPGSWVEIHTEEFKSYYCSIWPSNIPKDHVQFSPLIQVEGLSDDDMQVPRIIPIESFSTALKITLSYKLHESITDEQQLEEFGFIFAAGTIQQKLLYIRNFINHSLVKPNCTIRKSPLFSLHIISTLPSINTPVLLSPATRLVLTDARTNIPTQQLEQSLDQLSLNNTSSQHPLSSLEKAYNLLYQLVLFPFLHQPQLTYLHLSCPKGVLLYGPPGVGKTHLVTRIAHATNAKLFVIHGPELYSSYLGESEHQLRSIFARAREYSITHNQPVILFMDELDALTPKRDTALSYENRMVAQLLTLMDGAVKIKDKVVVVGATNRPNAIDAALRRPGRFDKEVFVEPPNAMDRIELFKSNIAKIPVDKEVSLEALAGATNGYVAADVSAVCREATMLAIQRASKQKDGDVFVSMQDFKAAFAVVGPSMQRSFQVQVEKIKWDDVGGLEAVKKRLKQAVEWPLLYKDSFTRLGLKPPRGILLYGPPGCSKTTLVKVIASSANVAFLSINGAQLYSPFVGDSEKVVRTTFQKARSSAPAIIFLDEIEAIVGKRNMGSGGSSGDSVQERVLSTLLNEMDGVESADSVLVVGATNRPDMLDAALMRPGRFDQAVYVPPPDLDARFQILKIHTRNMPLAGDVDLMSIAERTDYYTGADLQNICREAAMVALRGARKAQDVTMDNFNVSQATIPPSLTPESLKEYSKNPHASND